MATVVFYEKPGCSTNARQKQQLAAAGHHVIAKDLLAETWQADRLRAFFGDLPVAEWFNLRAPALKYGEIIPEKLSADEALALMVADPILIRRPLMQIGEHLSTGFDLQQLAAWLDLAALETDAPVTGCTKNGCGHD